jgi:hypothetical protein
MFGFALRQYFYAWPRFVATPRGNPDFDLAWHALPNLPDGKFASVVS